MTTQTEIIQKSHHRAVRFFWCLLVGATTISLVGNVVHAVLPYIPHVAIQIGAAAVPPVALLAAVHGVALAVRAGASGRIYLWAVGAVAAIGVGAFAMSFLALRDLMHVIGYSPETAWIFPAIIDTTVAVSMMMLVGLGDKPHRRSRAASEPASAHTPRTQSARNTPMQSAKSQVGVAALNTGQTHTAQGGGGQASASIHLDPAHIVGDSVQPGAVEVDADLASELRATGVTTQPVETVIAVLGARRRGASINAAATASGINYRTAQRIVEGAEARRESPFAAVG
jgi:hypothetical protein